MRLRFLKPVLILTLVFAAVLAYPLIAWFPETRGAIYAAWTIALVNTVIGMAIIEWTLDKENFVFMAAFFGGMGVRVMLTLMIFAFLLSEGFDDQTLTYMRLTGRPAAQTFFLMGFYFAYLILEIRFLVRVMSRQKGQKARKTTWHY